MRTMTNKAIKRLNIAIGQSVKKFKPPEELTVDEWADKHRRLSPETSAEAGPWRTARTPYLKEPMEAFTDPKIHEIAMVAASQVGKSELELNIIGYIIDQDPGSILFVQPTLDDARKFSRLRIAPMIRDSKVLREKVSDVKSKDSGNTILQKSFPGGMLTITGSNSASALASIPARYIIGDERDRWAISAGTEGDPWELAKARQTTFYNAKAVEVSTPTIKGFSNIETAYYKGTQERWCHKCPECGEYGEIIFDRIHYKHTVKKIRGKKTYTIDKPITWACPHCGCAVPEEIMRKQPAKWIADNPDAYKKGIRSFWLNAFSSPWTPWEKIVLEFLQARDDPQKLKVVYNTKLGELWEDRGDTVDEDTMLARREDYGTNADGSPVELPEGVLVLTCGVDTQDNRLEYEVVGHGYYGETWGIKKGIIMGKPDSDEVWQQLDDVIDHVYHFKDSQRGLRISVTFIDSGGHYTQEVYIRCRERKNKRVFAIKGKSGDGIPYTRPPTKVAVKNNKKITCWLYTLGVDAGKEIIMSNVKVQEPGAKYCHFPRGESYGYDSYYFNGLLSEKLELTQTRQGKRWAWVKIPGHERNEALDCRNYAIAGFRSLDKDMEAVERRLKNLPEKTQQKKAAPTRTRRNNADQYFDEW
ncbi:MAG TPA: phage terminase large subunit family protein [Candidatus Limivivens intestinipullorum]|uniref:Phage terminase large subunit family protein n=1 Tax=Candidatus Limivivens intestinipullorum TaxID=2840858 RepID=A0A9D1JKH3_9FIRM|nr:phage terminase large subunit family protein [Candidatus Limivivens intestinipullorum]